MKINTLLISLIGLSLLTFATPAFADEGEELYLENLCHTCHGEKGKALYPNYPNLAGHDAAYIQRQFFDIQSGRRSNGQTLVMKAFPTVQGMDEEDLAEIAKFLSKLK